MPSIHEFLADFGIKEALIVLGIAAIIVGFREYGRIFRRNRR
jgi:hypothetical protein